jgi:hypothetical protein
LRGRLAFDASTPLSAAATARRWANNCLSVCLWRPHRPAAAAQLGRKTSTRVECRQHGTQKTPLGPLFCWRRAASRLCVCRLRSPESIKTSTATSATIAFTADESAREPQRARSASPPTWPPSSLLARPPARMCAPDGDANDRLQPGRRQPGRAARATGGRQSLASSASMSRDLGNPSIGARSVLAGQVGGGALFASRPLARTISGRERPPGRSGCRRACGSDSSSLVAAAAAGWLVVVAFGGLRRRVRGGRRRDGFGCRRGNEAPAGGQAAHKPDVCAAAAAAALPIVAIRLTQTSQQASSSVWLKCAPTTTPWRLFVELKRAV